MTTSFVSGGKTISVQLFQPAKAGAPMPAILVLHGAGGLDAGNHYVRQLAAGVAVSGYATFLVEYFHRTGTTYASEQEIHAHFFDWVETIKDAANFASTYPGIDPKRIGTFGYSLGGYLAVAHAAMDSRIRAVVELAGGIDGKIAKTVKRLPPTLIIHGEQDQRVPFARAGELETLLKKLKAPVETIFFPNENHIFSPAAAIASLQRSLEFFNEQMP